MDQAQLPMGVGNANDLPSTSPNNRVAEYSSWGLRKPTEEPALPATAEHITS